MVTVVLLDADGTLIQGRKRYFSSILAEEQGLDEREVIQFFKNEYKDCVLGKLDLRDAVAKYVDAWKWAGSVDDLLQYWFSHDGKSSEEVLGVVRKLREHGMKVYLASDHTMYRANDIMERMGLGRHFDGGFFSCDLGHTKKEVAFFEQVAKKLGIAPAEMLFWDDERENVEAAEKAGVTARRYENFRSFNDELKRMGIL